MILGSVVWKRLHASFMQQHYLPVQAEIPFSTHTPKAPQRSFLLHAEYHLATSAVHAITRRFVQ